MPRTKDNGVAPTAVEAPQMFTLLLDEQELSLVMQMCANGQFQEPLAKRVAANVQDKGAAAFQAAQVES